jgi:hypothetical protein
MNADCIHFLLTPDRTAARRLRRILAAGGSRPGVAVGTWLELLDVAAQTYLLPPPEQQWETRLEDAMARVPDAFWSRSFQVARGETVSAVGRVFADVVSALEPGKAPEIGGTADLPHRVGGLVSTWRIFVASMRLSMGSCQTTSRPFGICSQLPLPMRFDNCAFTGNSRHPV